MTHSPVRPVAHPAAARRAVAGTAARRPLRLSIRALVGRSSVPFIKRHLLRAHSLLKPSLQELSIALVGPAEMANLHVRFMKIPGPTDVLTFPLDLDDSGNVTAGEVVLCPAVARERAREHGIDLDHELLLYAIHGMLHLSGFDDRTKRDFVRMHRMEDTLLTQLGIGPLFSRDASESPAFAPPMSAPTSKNRPAAVRGKSVPRKRRPARSSGDRA